MRNSKIAILLAFLSALVFNPTPAEAALTNCSITNTLYGGQVTCKNRNSTPSLNQVRMVVVCSAGSLSSDKYFYGNWVGEDQVSVANCTPQYSSLTPILRYYLRR